MPIKNFLKKKIQFQFVNTPICNLSWNVMKVFKDPLHKFCDSAEWGEKNKCAKTFYLHLGLTKQTSLQNERSYDSKSKITEIIL